MAELPEAEEAELQRLVAAEQQKAQLTAQVRGSRGAARGGEVQAWSSGFLLGRCSEDRKS